MVSIPVPSAPARRMAASISAATARSVTPGWIALHGGLKPCLGDLVGVADHRDLSRRLLRSQVAQGISPHRSMPHRAGQPAARPSGRRRSARVRPGQPARSGWRVLPDLRHDLGQGLDLGVGIIFIRMGELPQDAHIGDLSDQARHTRRSRARPTSPASPWLGMRTHAGSKWTGKFASQRACAGPKVARSSA